MITGLHRVVRREEVRSGLRQHWLRLMSLRQRTGLLRQRRRHGRSVVVPASEPPIRHRVRRQGSISDGRQRRWRLVTHVIEGCRLDA